MRKVISLILIFLFLISAVSCATESEADVDIIYDDGVNRNENFEGMDFHILYSMIYETEENILGFPINSAFADELSERINGIEKEYNCSISFLYDDLADQYVMASAASGYGAVDLLVSDYGNEKRLAMAGYLIPVDDMEDYIDVSDSFLWGTPNCLEQMMTDGYLYGVYPASWVGNTGSLYFAVVSNNTLLKRYGLTDLHELRENGKWNWDSFYTMATTDYEPDRDVYSLETFIGWFTRCACMSNGVEFVMKDMIGYRNGWTSQNAIEAIDWAKGLFHSAKDSFIGATDNDSFRAGQVLLTLAPSQDITNEYIYNEEVPDFSVMSFPQGPKSTGEYDGGYLHYMSRCICVPIDTKEPEYTASLLSKLFQPLGGISNYEELKAYYSKYVFMKESDTEELFGAVSEAQYIYNFEMDNDLFAAFETGEYQKSAVEIVESNATKLTDDIFEQIVPNRLAMSRYFGENYIFEGLDELTELAE